MPKNIKMKQNPTNNNNKKKSRRKQDLNKRKYSKISDSILKVYFTKTGCLRASFVLQN